MASNLPLTPATQLLRIVFRDEIAADGKIFSTAFTPRLDRDKGLLSTEHGERPGGAEAYRSEGNFDNVEGVYAITVAECGEQELALIDDGGEDGLSAWHVSVDFRPYVNEGYRLTTSGKRKARALAERARARGRRA